MRGPGHFRTEGCWHFETGFFCTAGIGWDGLCAGGRGGGTRARMLQVVGTWVDKMKVQCLQMFSKSGQVWSNSTPIHRHTGFFSPWHACRGDVPAHFWPLGRSASMPLLSHKTALLSSWLGMPRGVQDRGPTGATSANDGLCASMPIPQDALRATSVPVLPLA